MEIGIYVESIMGRKDGTRLPIFPPVTNRVRNILTEHYKKTWWKRDLTLDKKGYLRKCNNKKCGKKDYMWNLVPYQTPRGKQIYYCEECLEKIEEFKRRMG